jgi:hypothetical protein
MCDFFIKKKKKSDGIRKRAGGRITAKSRRFIFIDEASTTAPKSDVDRWHVSDDRSARRSPPAKGTFFAIASRQMEPEKSPDGAGDC